MRLYVGKFAGRSDAHEKRVREWCSQQSVGSGPIEVIGVKDVVARATAVAANKEYRDNAALVAMKVLEAAGALKLTLADTDADDAPEADV